MTVGSAVVRAVVVGMLMAACSTDASTEPPPPPVRVPTTVTVSPSSAAPAAFGETVQLTAAVNDQYGNAMTGEAVTWTSSTGSVAHVNAAGLVTAVDNGQTRSRLRRGRWPGPRR